MPTIFPASGRERRPSLDGLSDGRGRELADRELLQEGTDCVLVGLGPGGPMMEHPPANSPAATTNTTQMAAPRRPDRAHSTGFLRAVVDGRGNPDQHRDELRDETQIRSPYDASPGNQGLGD